MYPANITRAETAARAGVITTRTYELLVNLTGRDPAGAPLEQPDETFVTTSRIRFSAIGGVTYVDVIADQLLDATLNDAPIDTSLFDGNRLPIEVSEGRHELVVTAVHRYSRTGQGMHRFVDPADGRTYLYTQSEPADARRVFANFEQPDLKARFTISVIAPSHWIVASNAERVRPVPIDGHHSRWDFRPTRPLPTYLAAIVAGEYHEFEGTIQTTTRGLIPAALYCRASMLRYLDADRIMATTAAGFEVFEEHFGVPFPFDSYDQAFVPEYNAGAMENAGLVTLRDEHLFRSRATQAEYDHRDNMILHELAHMWFGNLVTMRWWDDLWLKESFAEWAAHFAQSVIEKDPRRSWATFCNASKTWAYRVDQLPSTHPITADLVDLQSVELNFDGITYAKGASALRQLVAFVGRDAFLAGAHRYFTMYSWGNTGLAELLSALGNITDRDLTAWADQWLRSAGVNTLHPELVVDENNVISEFDLHQTAPLHHQTLRDHRLAIGLYQLTDVGLERVFRVETDISGARTPIPELVGQPRPDLILLNDGDLTFAKIRMDEQSVTTMTGHIHRVNDQLTRALLWGTAWDMCRDGELAVSDYVDMVVRGVLSEDDQTTVSRILRQAQLASTLYIDPADRKAYQIRLTSGLARCLRDSEPGSDHQLAVTRALANSIVTPKGVELIAGWLEGQEVPEELVVDADLRWHLLTQLARVGAADEQRIAAELARDNTSTGAESAAGASASVRTEEGKARAWHLATADPDIPSEIHRQVCVHFAHAGQEHLLAPYSTRYFKVAEDIAAQRGVWRNHGVHLAQTALRHLFPIVTADEGFIAMLDSWFSTADLPPPIRRVIIECRDDAVRTLFVRQANKEDE